jgi:hypothetical protein
VGLLDCVNDGGDIGHDSETENRVIVTYDDRCAKSACSVDIDIEHKLWH